MDSSGKFNYVFRRYPVFRYILAILAITFIISIVYLVTFRTKQVPEIDSIVPPVGSPGDVIIINGKHFGDNRDMSYVEIAGERLTASSYVSWSDNCIKIVLPSNVQDGLLVVGTKNMRSKVALFANEVDIPVPVPKVRQVTKPVISSLSAAKIDIGDILTISGSNFGDERNGSKVLFTIDYSNKIEDSDFKNMILLTENMVPASTNDFDYVSWSDSEIKVHVPDGACSGVVLVQTGDEKSEPVNLVINKNAGYKKFGKKKIYLLQYTADVKDIVVSEDSTITLRCPIPFEFAAQPKVEITEVTPEPVLMNYQRDLIHQVHQVGKSKNSQAKKVFTQTFVLPVYEVSTKVLPDKIGNYSKTEKNLLSLAVRPDNLVPSSDEKVAELAAEIVGKEKNAYRKAQKVYDYMCDNFKILEKSQKNDDNPLELLRRKRGDAYDFAVIYAALLRACEIPAFVDAGILVDQDLMTRSHWWCEFYVDKVGWIPVDVAIGAGYSYKTWTDSAIEDVRGFYFGNLDSHHILFSRGWSQLKPFSQDNKIVQQPRSFALQSIWEEASADTVKYSSYWSVPVVKGIY